MITFAEGQYTLGRRKANMVMVRTMIVAGSVLTAARVLPVDPEGLFTLELFILHGDLCQQASGI
jgi:hypothetical protein